MWEVLYIHVVLVVASQSPRLNFFLRNFQEPYNLSEVIFVKLDQSDLIVHFNRWETRCLPVIMLHSPFRNIKDYIGYSLRYFLPYLGPRFTCVMNCELKTKEPKYGVTLTLSAPRREQEDGEGHSRRATLVITLRQNDCLSFGLTLCSPSEESRCPWTVTKILASPKVES